MEIGRPDDAGRRAGLRDLAHAGKVDEIGERRAAIGLRDEHRVEAERVDVLDIVPGEFAAPVVGRRARRDLFAGEGAHAVEQQRFLVAQPQRVFELVKYLHAAGSLLWGSERHSLATVDVDRLAGQEGDVLGVERGDEAGDLLRRPRPARRRPPLQPAEELLVAQRIPVEIRLDVARRYVHHGDAVARPFGGEAAGDRADGRLGRAVGEVARDADAVEEGADVDDAAAARRLEVRIGFAARHHHGGRVGAHQRLEVRGRKRGAVGLAVDAGVVDEAAQASGLLDDMGESIAHAGFVCHVAARADVAPAGRRLFRQAAGPRQGGHREAAPGKLDGDRRADAAARSRHRDGALRHP